MIGNNPSIRKKTLNYEWAATQPFIELLVAAGLGSRKLLRKQKTFVAWTKPAEVITEQKQKYGGDWMGRFCEEAYAFSAWETINLEEPIPYDQGIVTVKRGRTLVRIILI